MTTADAIQISAAIIAGLGGGGAIVFGLSNFLGKIWAERLMITERRRHDQELTELRLRLEKNNEECLSKLQTELEIYRETHLKRHNDKIATYRLVIEVVADFLGDLEMIRLGQQVDHYAILERFNRGRLKAHGHLGMLAPQRVLDAYDSLVDHIFYLIENGYPNNPQTNHERWKGIRKLVFALINAIRQDIGIDTSKVEYRGKR